MQPTIDQVRAAFCLFLVVVLSSVLCAQEAQPLKGTQPLNWEGDLAERLVAGVDRFLLREIERSVDLREQHFHRDFTSPEKYQASLEPNRKRLAHILGVRDKRHPVPALEFISTTQRPALVGGGKGYAIYAVRWPAFADVHGYGLLLTPTSKPAIAQVIAVPDADVLPEMLAGLAPGLPPRQQYARRLAEAGCRVIVPALVNRQMREHRRVTLTNREYLYRPAFELGRHLIGYELQQIFAAATWLMRESGEDDPKLGIVGWGEGGLLALYAGALDTRFDVVCVSGYFDSRQNLWQEPIDRNVFGLLEQFGDAELASMVAPRALHIEASRGPEFEVGGKGGGPGRLVTPQRAAVQAEFARAKKLVARLKPAPPLELLASGAEGTGPPLTEKTLQAFLKTLSPQAKLPALGPLEQAENLPPHDARQERMIREIVRHNEWLLAESPYLRKAFFKDVDTSSLQSFRKTIEPYRKVFAEEIIGKFDRKPLPANPRSRLAYDKPKWKGYEVVLDVFPDVFAYGILLVPQDIKEGERRPVVVCQHGLEGRPQQLVEGDHRAYHDFAAKLVERGFVTFAPQNLYIGRDKFRTLQRKANPLKKTLFSIIVPQHQQIVDWLKTLPFVDGDRIGFYGLSYGGKTAMRVPALVDDYALSICSGDFNDWIWKNASTRSRYSYVGTGEYEIFEFDLGMTFNYAEMAALICPRPFMVERGHFDGVAPDERVAYEYAKVRHLYQAQLGVGERTEIEWFVGPHTIHGVGTFDFLHKHLKWPK